jgi:hypothetical protein
MRTRRRVGHEQPVAYLQNRVDTRQRDRIAEQSVERNANGSVTRGHGTGNRIPRANEQFLIGHRCRERRRATRRAGLDQP